MNASVNQALGKTLALVLAGGQGSRLKQLTQSRSKPVLEFGGHCRIIDFPLSNCVNSGIRTIGVLTQYKSQCLIRHLMQHWGPLNSSFGGRLDVLPASQQTSLNWYQGTADACFQNLDYIRSMSPDYVIILAGDHVYQMDYREQLRTHINNKADMTVSCIEVPINLAINQLGVVQTDSGDRIYGFAEKPRYPAALADAPEKCLASMGNYIVNTDVLLELLNEDAVSATSEHDFGKNVLPRILQHYHVFAHRYRDQAGKFIPYWRDVGTIDSYWQAHMDLLASPTPLNLADPSWPIWGLETNTCSSEITSSNEGKSCEFDHVRMGTGCQLVGCNATQTIISREVSIGENSAISQTVILPEVKIGANVRLKNTIVDRGVVIPSGFAIDNANIARSQGFTVSDSGIILITQQDIDSLTSTRLCSSVQAERYCCAAHVSHLTVARNSVAQPPLYSS